MLNEEKIKSMTKAAAFEMGAEKENLKINQYFRSDYLGLQMIKALFAYVVAFCLFVTIWLMMGSEEIMLHLTRADYLKKISKVLLVIFFVVLVLYEGLVYAHYSRKYRRMKDNIEGYQGYLKKISKFYDIEESAEDEVIEIDLADEVSRL